MKHWKHWLAAGLATASLVAVVGACGDGNFVDEDAPVFSIEGISGPQIQLDLNLLPGRHTPQGTTLILRNSGLGPLKVTKMEWVSRPERLVVDAGRIEGLTCSSDPDCGDGGVCIRLSESGICRATVFPQTPFTIEPNNRRDFGFLILDAASEFACPEPHAEVPAELATRYCGELVIETNDQSTAGIITEGKTRIYFVTDGSSGELRIEPSVAQFANATAGVTQTARIVLRNAASQPLFVERADIYNNSDWFEFTPALPTTIAGNGQSEHTLTFRPPASAQDAELEFSTKMVFASSSSGRSAQELLIQVTRAIGDRPRIEVDPLTLSFTDATTQIITVRNLGNATLLLTGATFRPAAIRPYYQLFFNGTDITSSFPTGSAAPRLERVQEVRDDENNVIDTVVQSLELEVRFIAPADESISTVGTLELRHNDEASGRSTEITLMGADGDAPIGGVTPLFATFSVHGGATTREVVVHNRGTEALTITNIDVQPAPNTEPNDFYGTGLTGTIAPGAFLTGTIGYNGGASNIRKSAQIVLVSNTAGQIGEMTFSVAATLDQPAIITPVITPSFSSNALVGQSTTFTASVNAGSANLGSTVWALHGRPASSQAFFSASGTQASFVPDVPGAYKVSAIVPDTDGQEVQVFLEFNAVN
jgi:hypothetical protein